jgi:ribonuclease HII
MAASIIAKVTRDRIMKKAHEKYPQYGFDKHKGYGTRSHFEAIKKYGPCEIHRKSFEPIRSGCQNHTRLLTKNQAYDILPIRSRKRRDLKIFLK